MIEAGLEKGRPPRLPPRPRRRKVTERVKIGIEPLLGRILERGETLILQAKVIPKGEYAICGRTEENAKSTTKVSAHTSMKKRTREPTQGLPVPKTEKVEETQKEEKGQEKVIGHYLKVGTENLYLVISSSEANVSETKNVNSNTMRVIYKSTITRRETKGIFNRAGPEP
jgi:hypothetical protein